MSSQGSREIGQTTATVRKLISEALNATAGKIAPGDLKQQTKGGSTKRTGTQKKTGQRRQTSASGKRSGANSANTQSRRGGEGNRNNGRTGTQRRKSGNTPQMAAWEIPGSECPPIDFAEGEIAEAFDCVEKLIVDFLPAGMAFVNHLANCQPYRSLGRAQNLRTLLLMQSPTRASLLSASHSAASMHDAQIREDYLSARLALLGQRYLLLLEGAMPVNQSTDEMINELLKIAGEFGDLNHPRREAYARIIAADIFNVFKRNFTRAKEEMVRAIALLAVVFQADEAVDLSVLMTRIASSGDETLAARTVGSLGLKVGHDGQLAAPVRTDSANFQG